MTYPITRQFGPNAKGSELSFTDMDNNLLYLDAKVTGSNNYITLFSGSSAISSSIIYQLNGGIGIGTTNPYSIFNVIGTTTIGYPGVSSNSHVQFWPTNTGGNAYYIIDSASILKIGTGEYISSGTDILSMNGSGNVGVGTTTPQAKFVISNNGAQGMEFGYSAALTSSYIESYNRSSSAAMDMTYYISPGTGSHRFYTGGGERMRIDKDGYVGIGKTNPTAPLDVLGGVIITGSTIIKGGDLSIISSYPRLYLTDTDSNSDFSIINDNGALNIYDDTNGASRIYIASSGNVGIGTTNPLYKLSSHGTSAGRVIAANFSNDTNAGGTEVGIRLSHITNTDVCSVNLVSQRVGADAGADFSIELADSAGTPTERFRITEGGNVGIGITTPTAKLDVNGNTLITGSLTTTGATIAGTTLTTGGATTIGTTLTTGGKLGYADTVGGIVVQGTSRTTTVTLNTACGRIKAFLDAGSISNYTRFTVNNNTVNQVDVVIVNVQASANKYRAEITRVQAGSFEISYISTSGTTSDQPIFSFAVIKAGSTQSFPGGGGA